MNKNTIIIITIAIIILGGLLLYSRFNSKPTELSDTATNQIEAPTSIETESDNPPTTNAKKEQDSVKPTLNSANNEDKDGLTINYTNNGFEPSTKTIKKEEAVNFINQSDGAMWVASGVHPSHRIYSETSLTEHCPDSAGVAFDQCGGGDEYLFTFNKAGTWKYHNHLRPGDTAEIVVE